MKIKKMSGMDMIDGKIIYKKNIGAGCDVCVVEHDSGINKWHLVRVRQINNYGHSVIHQHYVTDCVGALSIANWVVSILENGVGFWDYLDMCTKQKQVAIDMEYGCVGVSDV